MKATIQCKKEFIVSSEGDTFEKGKYYPIDFDSSESCYVYLEIDGNPYSGYRFYYEEFFGESIGRDRGYICFFEDYFNGIKEIRKQKLLKIYESHI